MPEKQPRKGSSKKAVAEKLSGSSVKKKFWTEIDPTSWKNFFSKLRSDGQFEVSGSDITCLCPYHNDNNPSMRLSFIKGMGKCFSCGHVVVDLVSFVAKLANCSQTEAIVKLASHFDLARIIGTTNTDGLAEINNQQEMKKCAAIAFRKVVEEYIREQPGYLSYIKPAYKYITIGRGVNPELLSGMLPIGVFPKPEHAKKYIPEEYHDLYESYFKSVNSDKFFGSVIFHYNDMPGSISRFKLRLLNKHALRDSEKAVTALDCKGLMSKNFNMVDDPYFKDTLGLFGLNFYNRIIGDNSDVIITEGEFDALSIMSGQGGSIPNMMIFATGGTGNNNLAFLREIGVRTIWLVQDTEAKNGMAFTRAMLTNKDNYITDVVNKQLSFKIFTWPKGILGGDLAEAVELQGYKYVYDALWTRRLSTFINSYSWTVDNCKDELKGLKDEYDLKVMSLDPLDHNAKNNVKELYLKSCYEVIRRWYSFIEHDPYHRKDFAQEFSSIVDISSDAIIHPREKSRYDIAIELMVDELRNYISPAYFIRSLKTTTWYAWSKVASDVFAVPLTSAAELRSTLNTCMKNRDVFDIVEDKMREAGIFDELEEPMSRGKLDREVGTILINAVNKICTEGHEKSTLQRIGQGIHFKDLGERNNSIVYIVNGRHIFKGKYKSGSSVKIEWEKLDSVVDDNYLFIPKSAQWTDITDVSELYKASSVDLKELYKDIKKILDGWTFKNHDFTSNYLAHWILSSPVQRAMNTVNVLLITGASASGKTSLLRGLLGGRSSSGYEIPAILESSWFSVDATAASIYQQLDEASLTLCLDEAEYRDDANTAHTRRVKEIHELLYNLSFGGIKTNRGSASSESKNEYNLKMPVVMAAINKNSNPTFLSRIIPIYTEKQIAHHNISSYLDEYFSDEDFDRIRRNITLCFLDKLPELCDAIPEVKKKVATVRLEGLVASDRFTTIHMPVLAVMHYMGVDVCEVYRELIDNYRSLIENINSQDYQSDLLAAILYSQSIEDIGVDSSIKLMVSPKQLILDDRFDDLNAANKGILVIPEKNWIVLLWRDIKYTILARTPYSYKDENDLRESISQNKYTLPITNEDHRYIIKKLGKTDVKRTSDYSIVSLEYILDMSKDQLMPVPIVDSWSNKNDSRENRRRSNNSQAIGDGEEEDEEYNGYDISYGSEDLNSYNSEPDKFNKDKDKGKGKDKGKDTNTIIGSNFTL